MKLREFIKETEEGQRLLLDLMALIEREHQKAEDTPDLSRDHMQRAKGIREAVSLIQSKTAPDQKGLPTRKHH